MFLYDITQYTYTPSSYYNAWDCSSRCTFSTQNKVFSSGGELLTRGSLYFLGASSIAARVYTSGSIGPLLQVQKSGLQLSLNYKIDTQMHSARRTALPLPRLITGTLGRRGHNSVACCLFTHTPPPPLIASGRNTQQSAVTNVAAYGESSTRHS